MNPLHAATRGGGVARLDAAAVGALRDRLRGRLMLPGEPGFAEATTLWNGMIRKAPAMAIQPEDAEDVAQAVAFAVRHDLLISAKGGGHNIAGTAIADGGIVLDMARIRHVRVDPEARLARVGAGCLLRDVDAATQQHGLATPLGFVSDTGVAGLTLGGGFGYLSRRFGWAVDNLVEVEIVTADGEVRRANAKQHEDLFWALRGGGGNFGVVTEFVFRLHEVGPTIMGGIRGWPAETPEQAEAALRAYRDLTRNAPRELTVFCMVRRAPPAPFVPAPWHGRRVALFLICHSGGDAARAARDLAPLSDALGEPVIDVVAPRPYAEQQSLLDEAEPHGMHYYWKAEFVSDLKDPLVETVRDLSQENPVPMAEIGFLHIGGAINERASDDGAVGNRDARYIVGIAGMWPPDDPEGEAHRAWVRHAWMTLRPFSSGGNYVNFQTADDDEGRIRATYGGNYERLAQVKRRYDPENLFRSNRNIPPA